MKRKVVRKKASENKKVRNATHQVFDGIEFKSKLEVSCYKILKEAEIPFEYESMKILLHKGFHLADNVHFYKPKKKCLGNALHQWSRKILDITYTPDFVVKSKTYLILIDVKGYRNDVYGYKLKLLLNILSKQNKDRQYYFYEPHTVTQMRQMANDIKGLLKADA